jgi:hypothetical protein
MSTDFSALQYPVGKFEKPETVSAATIVDWIEYLAGFPRLFRTTAESLSETQLDTPYRPEGWTGRQVVHHVADSHMNAFIRFKLALTEDFPTIKPYEESKWALLPDAKLPIEVSLRIIENVHERWICVLRGIDDWENQGYYHPQMGTVKNPLSKVLALYHWHSRHHLGHLEILKGK